MKRIFIAVDISDDAKMKVADYIEKLGSEYQQIRVGWEKTEKLHLTLKFLGDIDEKQLENLVEAVENTAGQISNFQLQISDTGIFPSNRKARILWLGLKNKTGELQNLNKILETECEKIGFAKEKRNFHPHLTVARLREPHKSKEIIESHLENQFSAVECSVSEITIYESRLQKSGSIYEAIKNVKLKN